MNARPRSAARPGAARSPRPAAPKGQLTAPVAGTVFRSWGDPTDAGPATGISYHAAPAARVVSPCAGRVEFAAPFRSYGLLLILDCGGGYHAVLAGFDRLDAEGRPGRPARRAGRRDAGLGARHRLARVRRCTSSYATTASR